MEFYQFKKDVEHFKELTLINLYLDKFQYIIECLDRDSINIYF